MSIDKLAKVSSPLPDLLDMKWDHWKDHPTWLTVRQHSEKGLVPQGEPVAQVWYSNMYMKRRGEEPFYLLLYDSDLATPKVVDSAKAAALARGKETARINRTCEFCGHERSYKIKRDPRMCNSCYDAQCEIEEARAWLADPNTVVVDTETTDLDGEIIDIAIKRVDGLVLLDTRIKPIYRIDERDHVSWEDYGNGYGREKRTAFSIHHISNEMVKDAPYFVQLWGQIETLLMFRTVLCYNVAFDYWRLDADVRRLGFSTKVPGKWECVMEWYTAYHGEYNYRRRRNNWVSLDNACGEQDVYEDVESHTALGDATRTLALIKAIAAKKTPMEKVGVQ